MPLTLPLQLLVAELAIVRLGPDAGLPWWAAGSEAFLALTRTGEETSIVCEARRVPEGVQAERGYRAIRVEGTIPFHATGVLTSIAQPLVEASVPIFAISTFDTDYVLVPEARLTAAIDALKQAGHAVR